MSETCVLVNDADISLVFKQKGMVVVNMQYFFLGGNPLICLYNLLTIIDILYDQKSTGSKPW